MIYGLPSDLWKWITKMCGDHLKLGGIFVTGFTRYAAREDGGRWIAKETSELCQKAIFSTAVYSLYVVRLRSCNRGASLGFS